MHQKRRVAILSFLTLATAGGTAFAQAKDPAFEYGTKDEKAVEEVEWAASAQAGLIATTGNSKTVTFSGGAKASHKKGFNKFQLEGETAFTRSQIRIAADADGDDDLGPGEIITQDRTTAKSWLAKARYDRFLTAADSLYVVALASADQPAGKDLVGGGQGGYSRVIYEDDAHEVVAEAGYDFSYESLAGADNLAIHSARAFASYVGKVTDETEVSTSLETLLNLNELDGAAGTISPFEDARVTGKVGLTTTLWKDLSFRFAFTLKFDNAPAPRPPLSIPYEMGFVPLADEVDTKTEATLILSFL